MNRREVLSGIATLSAGALTRSSQLIGAAPPAGPSTVRTPALAEFERLQFGVSYHFSMNTFTGDDYETGKVPATTYNPTHLDRPPVNSGGTRFGSALRGAHCKAYVWFLSLGFQGI